MIPKEPYDAWQVDQKKFPLKGNLHSQLKFLINYAILAPSSHNTQPWIFKIKDNVIEILPNLERTLDYSDRTHRELNISLGCALANLLIAASHFGFDCSQEYLPEDTLDEVAVKIKLSRAGKTNNKLSNLFPYIKLRVTNRTPYLNKKINKKILTESLQFLDEPQINLHFVTEESLIIKISQLIYEAHMFAFGDQYFKEELSSWVRPIYSRKKDGMPLFGFGIPGPLTVFAKKMIRYVPAKIQSSKDKKLVNASPCLLIVTAKHDTKETWLKAGKILEYLFLNFKKNDIALAPLAGVVEHDLSRKKLMNLLGTNEFPLFFARVGYPSAKVHQSPRILASEVINS